MPHARNAFFTGREEVLARLHKQLRLGPAAALTQTQAISGLGGIGKTQTAIEYAYRYRGDYQAVFWTVADSREAVMAGFIVIATLLNLPQKEAQDQNITAAAVKQWLEANSNWLFVFDNVDDPQVIDEFLPLHHHGKVLLTSRAYVFDTFGISSPIGLEELSPQEAQAFLIKRTGRGNLNPVERAAVEQLAQELDYLPLALEQAAAYLVAKQTRFQDYLVGYRKHGLKLLERAKPVAGKYPKSVATTWLLNVEQVEKESAAAADVLRSSAFLHPDNIPLELLIDGAAELGLTLSAALAHVKQDPLVLDEVLEPLTRYSLIRRNLELQTYNIHRLVQRVLKDGMDEPMQRLWAERTVRALNRVFPDGEFSQWPLCERLLPHALTCADLIEGYSFEFSEAAHLLNQVGFYLADRAQYAQAESLYQRALAILQNVFGPDHPHTATSLNNLAALYDDQGRYSEAEPLYQWALAIREKGLGPEHPDTAIQLGNLAALYNNQGRYTEAEPLYQRALAIREKGLGPDHPHTASSLNNLAGLYYKQGRYSEAEPLYQRALAICKRALGPEHPDTAIKLGNLARLYDKQGRYSEAEPLYQRTLTVHEKTLGPEHPHTATSLSNLASLYKNQELYAQAQPLYQRALAIYEKVLGSEHPHTTTSLNNLAALYDDQGRYTEAELLHQRALAVHEKTLGPEHPHTATSLNNLAGLYYKQGRYSEAEPLYQRALMISTKGLGPEHPDTATSLNNLARLYDLQGRYVEAELLYRRSLTIREKTLGFDHPHVAISLERYATLLRKTNREDEAEKLEARARAIREKQERKM